MSNGAPAGGPAPKRARGMDELVCERILSMSEDIARGKPIDSILGDVVLAFSEVFGLRDLGFQVVSPELKIAFDHGMFARGVELPKTAAGADGAEGLLLREEHRISKHVYFSRADDWQAAHKSKDPCEGSMEWRPGDMMWLKVGDVDGRPLAFINIGGSSEGLVPPPATIGCLSVFTELLSVALAREREIIETATVSNKMAQRTDLLEDVLRIASSIVSERDFKKLSDMILSSVSGLFGFAKVTLVVFDEAVGAFRWMALFGYPEEVSKEAKFRTIPMDVVLEDLRESRRIGRTVYFTPIEHVTPRQQSYYVMPETIKGPLSDGAREKGEYRKGDCLAFSLHDSNGRIVGVIYPAEPKDARIPDGDTIETIEIFTSLAEVALENARLSAEKETALRLSGQRTEQLSRIFDLVSDIMYVRDLDHLLNDVLKMLAQLLGLRRMTIGIRDDTAGTFKVRAVYGYSDDAAEAIKKVEYPIPRVDFIMDPKGKFFADTPVRWRKKVGRYTYYIPMEGVIIGPEDSPYYMDSELMRLPRKGEGYWHELDYMDTFIFNREGVPVAYIELLKPRDDRVPDADTIEIIEIFAGLVAVAVENSAMFQSQIESRKSAEFYTDLLSHDIKNFNQAIMGYIELLKVSMTKPEQVAMMDKLSQQVMNVSRLAGNVRTMSRLTWGGGKLVRTDMGSVLLDCFMSVPQYYMNRRIKFEHQVPSGKHYVMADELLKELFVNILTNAVRYDTHDPVEIGVTVEEGTAGIRPTWVVAVSDHGPGISDEMKVMIFERFAHGVPKKGSGLGLHIVTQLARRYRGKVWAEDRVKGDHSQGAVFKVELPMAE